LLRAGVLRLVDQHVVDAEIELVVHPGGIDPTEQIERLVDEVVIIEQAAAVLFRLIAREHRMGDGEQRRRAVAAHNGAASIEQFTDALLFREEALKQGGMPVANRLGDDALARRKLVRAENPEIELEALAGAKRGELDQPVGVLAIGFRAFGQSGGHSRPFLSGD
jgi:hypothetical protein